MNILQHPSTRTWAFVLTLLLLTGCGGRKDRAEAEAADEAAQTEALLATDPDQAVNGAAAEDDAGMETAAEQAAPPETPTTREQVASPGSNEAYVLNELNFEIKKLGADLKHLASELRDLQGKSTMWANPLTIYSKEIILSNGSTIFGKIVYQDEKILKVETLIGYLIVERSSVVRIVENIPSDPLSEAVPLESASDGSGGAPTPANRVVQPSFPSGQVSRPTAGSSRSRFGPNVVLVGTIKESKDRSGNLRLTGSLKNIGGRRADFVKVSFVFRRDWSGNTKTLTSFAQGSFHSFESGITSEASLLPGASGVVELYVPQSFGTFIGYSYTIEWEDY